MPICNTCRTTFDTEENLLNHIEKRHLREWAYYLEGQKTEQEVQQDRDTLKAFMVSLKQIAEELGINYYYGSAPDGEADYFWKGRFKMYIDLPDVWPWLDMEDV